MSDPSPIDRLRVLVLGDPSLQDDLAAIDDRLDFAAAAATAAAQAGLTIDPADIAAACRHDPAGIARFDATPPTETAWPPLAWLPSALVPTVAGPAVDWAYFGAMPLTDPFFEDTRRRTNWRPLNQLCRVRTPLNALASAMPPGEQCAPDALIFHMSRCGSTLVSQMLAAVPTNVVVSEAAPLDAVIQLAHTNPDLPADHRIELIRAMASALGRDRFGKRARFVIKLDSWHTLALPLIRAAFPGTPWIFLFRDPVEVMVSHKRIHGSQMVQGMMPPGFYGFDDSALIPADEFAARALAAVCGAAIEHRGAGGGMFVDYASLPDAVEERILPHFGIVPTDAERATMRAATARDAKATNSTFSPDSRGKQDEASDAVRALADQHLAAIHRQLRMLAADAPLA
ncbi:sulfotransferase [Sphingomonas sp.]|jgi:hypothetical protein|uniref:sulfotransferase n=1 Tax=Sphingomonas sp. TaxID=28214 RepID=UPI002E3035AD|nr:sulfotransferase [Sphingomonas sp.]HEX4695933.1 sulfotransferase [Sphingomonas sp.]